MPGPLTIVFCANSAFGIANFRGGVIRALVGRGHKVVVVAPDDPWHVDTLRGIGATFVPWAISGQGTGVLGELSAIRRLISIYREVRPDLAFHFTIKAVIYGAIAARICAVPFVPVITGLGYVFLNENAISKVARALYAWTLRWAREVWFLNADDRSTFERLRLIEGVPIRLLPGEGIDTKHFAAVPLPMSGRPAGAITFLMIARLLKDKGVLEFIEAAKQVLRAYPAARFQLLGPAGSANPSAISRSDIDRLTADGCVEYLGEVGDVRPAIAAADCIVLPSYREGAPRALLEAASMGRAIVASDVPGCRDVLVDGVSGVLCRPRDSGSLADSMSSVARLGSDGVNEMGRRGRQWMIDHFDEAIVINHYLTAIERLNRPRDALAERSQ